MEEEKKGMRDEADKVEEEKGGRKEMVKKNVSCSVIVQGKRYYNSFALHLVPTHARRGANRIKERLG